jgi:hypothetical protein
VQLDERVDRGRPMRGDAAARRYREGGVRLGDERQASGGERRHCAQREPVLDSLLEAEGVRVRPGGEARVGEDHRHDGSFAGHQKSSYR